MFVWDTAGQERFRQIARMYYNEVAGAFVCFDLTDEDSFRTAKFWIEDLKQNAPANAVKILLGLKVDLVRAGLDRRPSHVPMQRQVTTEQAYIFA